MYLSYKKIPHICNTTGGEVLHNSAKLSNFAPIKQSKKDKMRKAIISIVAIICQLISDYSMGLNKINKPDPPEFFKYYAALNRHFLAQNAFIFLGSLIGGIILYICFKKCISNKKRSFTMADAQKKREEILGGKYIEYNYVGLFLVSIFIALSTIQNSLPNQIQLESNFWMLELIFIINFISSNYENKNWESSCIVYFYNNPNIDF